MNLVKFIKDHEGFSSIPYIDTVGNTTIGYGVNLRYGISEREATLILEERIRKLRIRMPMIFKFWSKLSVSRQNVLMDMAYNLGVAGVLRFKRMLDALEAADYTEAAEEMLDSIWAIQVGDEVGQRAYMLSEIMRIG